MRHPVSPLKKKHVDTRRNPPGYVPLVRALSKLGVASRTEAARAIANEEVQVNGKAVTKPDFLVIPEKSQIVFRGEPVQASRTRVILFHKPRKVMTTRSDPEGRKTVYSFFENELPGFHTVGRLDYNTSGLLLLTNDTNLSNRLTDPANQLPRCYLARVRGRVTASDTPLFENGIMDKGELLRASKVTLKKCSNRESTLFIELISGKNREIRRLCKGLHHEVNKLKRISFGNFRLGDLAPGQFQDVAPEELQHYLQPGW
ncbi:MAG: rRNA pseudouridine synthase [Deltaproteobacteria bacterium]|nr:rRNA pseudouridine synthase [Deltaproteobacteria bacterium]